MAASPPRSLIAAMLASSTRVTQSHMTLPWGVWTSSARCPMATGGRVSMAVRPGSSSYRWFWRPSAWSAARVVHCWPFQPTYCRSSSQIGQRSGGCSLGAYWTPQVRQMNASMLTPPLIGMSRHGATPEAGAASAWTGDVAQRVAVQSARQDVVHDRRAEAHVEPDRRPVCLVDTPFQPVGSPLHGDPSDPFEQRPPGASPALLRHDVQQLHERRRDADVRREVAEEQRKADRVAVMLGDDRFEARARAEQGVSQGGLGHRAGVAPTLVCRELLNEAQD